MIYCCGVVVLWCWSEGSQVPNFQLRVMATVYQNLKFLDNGMEEQLLGYLFFQINNYLFFLAHTKT